ncbi:hypothetical protein DCC81_08615 [Chitinophaga parva]|uniref:Uncharacterized protein n=1 Tax=Chitinophaga parva TaxID=2169414 RepID=A0A2T7BP98_9BACT|nr:hypothetical protein DCC81_08615 [Chitinophaga parva]
MLIAAAAFAPAKAQLKLGDNPTSINKDAILELNSDHQGLLFPRVLKAQIVAGGGLFGAVDGLVVYVTDESCLYLKKGGIWTKLGDNISAGTGIAISPLGVISNTGVLQFNGRSGNVTPASGDYNLGQLGDVALGTLTTGDVLYYNGTKWTNWTPDLAQLGAWSVNGNNITAGKFFGTTNNADIIFKTNNAERGRFLSDGRLELGGVDYTNAQYLTANLMVKNRMIIEGNGTGSNNELIFTKASTGGVMRIADDQNDFQIQGGSALNLALGANKGIVLSGDNNNSLALPTSSTSGTGVLIPAARDASVPLGIQAKSATQTANLTEWRDASGNVLSIFDKAGNLGLGTTAAARTLHVQGTMRLTGDVTGATATGLMGRDANGDVTTVTPPAVIPANPVPTWSLAANVLNINNTAALWNANKIQGVAVPAPSGTNSYLKYDGTNLSWATSAASGVTSVGLSMPGIFTVTNSPVTGTGTLTASLATQAANTVFAGPASGASAAPTFRALTVADIPTLGGYIQNQFTAAQATSNFWISGNGKTGGTMEVGGTSGSTTGLKFTGINSSTTPATANNVMLTLDASGNVILAKNPATNNWLTTGNSSPDANAFLGTITDDLMNIRSSNLPFLTFGKRGLIPGLTQSYPGYQDALEKVTYVQSALQFQADAASFYKPKMWTDSLGNFHMMGPMAGTDYFEFAAGGKDNAGEFDITSGDDGDEPIVFRNYYYSSSTITEWARVQKGKFGINTPGTEPARTLHVNGDMRLVNDASGANAANVLAKDNNGDVTSVSGTSNGQVLQYNGTQWQAGPQMLHYTNISVAASGGNVTGTTTYTFTVDLSSKMGSTTIGSNANIIVNFENGLPNGMALAYVLRNASQKITIGIINAGNTAKFTANTIDVTIIQ